MKAKLFTVFLLCIEIAIYAQVENTTSLRIDSQSDLSTNKFSLSGGLSTPELNSPLYTPPKALSEYSRQKPTFDMTGKDGFFRPKSELTPKWFQKDKEINDKFKSDQYFGDFKSNGLFVQLVYRDHESVDGDKVRIFLNDEVILSKVYLTGSFEGITIDLTKGFNKIDIQALNQGDSGPNTAEFHLYDDQGNLITGNEWNLTTGVKATLIVVKD